MIASLSGSHRCGKTTLARAYAEKHKLVFLETSASAIFEEFGLDPAVTYDFDTRMGVQEILLKRFDKEYAKCCGPALTITDRSPLDLLAYTLADVSGDTLTADSEARLKVYIENCISVINRRFVMLMLIQPGIPLVAAPGKAAMSPGYIEHLNSLILGLMLDERVKVPHFYMQRSMTDMEDRLLAFDFAVRRIKEKVVAERKELNSCQLH